MVAKCLDHKKGSLGNNDGDGNENGKKEQLVYIIKTTTLHVHHAFLHILQPSLHDCEMKLSNFTRRLLGVGVHNTKSFIFFFPELRYGPFGFNPDNIANI